MKLNLRTKLIGSFVIILLLMVGVGLMGTHTSKTIRDRLDNIIEREVKPANILGDVSRRVGFIRANSLLHLLTRSIDDMNRYESEVADWIDRVNTNLNTLENIFEDQATLDKLAEFRTAWETYLRIWREQVVPLSRANRDEEAFTLARKMGAGGMAAREAMYKLDELHDVNAAAASHRLELANQDSRKSQYILSAVILLAIILGLAFGIRQGSLIAGPVNTVSKAAQLVAAGDFDQRVMVKTGDEIESMANSFNTMTVKLKTMVEELQHEITERRRAEDRLRESKQWLSTTLRSIGDAVIATDAEGLVTLMNPVAEDLTGWDETETAGKPLEDIFNIINDQTGRRAENPVARVLREGVVVGLANHTVLIAKDGTKRPIADSGAPMRDEEGEIVGAVIVFRDITELKQAEEELRKHRDHLEELVKDRTEALRESEEKYREVVETSVDGVISVDSQMKVGVWNKGAEGIFGYTEEEMTGQSLMKIVPERYKKEMEKGFVEFRKSGLSPVIGKTLELQGVRKDGTEIPVEVSVSSRKKNETHIATAIVRDITERKKTEDVIRESQKNLKTIVESIQAGIVVIDVETRTIIDANTSAIEMIGAPKEQLIGKICHNYICPAEKGECPIIDLGQKVYNTESTLIKANGEAIPTLRTATPILFNGKECLLDCFINLTEKKKLEAQLLQSQKMESIGRLAGGIAHDFNNMLTIITGYAKFAQDDLREDTPQYDNMKNILEAGQRAASLTRQLLAFSRKQVVQPEILNLNDTLKGTESMLRRLIGEDIDLVSVFAPGLWNIEVDPGQMEQVLMNLAVNARDAMPRGGKLTIETANMDLDEEYLRDHGVENTAGSYVMLAISDNGMGMDKETRSHIFEPFYTTKEKGQGTGLGLSTVYGIVKQNKGYIWVYSEPGEGTSFKVYFPAVEGDAGSVDKRDNIPEDRLKGPETILLVEDDEKLRRMAQKVFKSHEYTVFAVSNGDEALRLSGEHEGPIHLLLTDVVMPGMSGEELAKQIESQRPKIKVLYMSGYTGNAIAHHGVLDKGVNFIQKPFLPDDLVHKARKVLDQGD